MILPADKRDQIIAAVRDVARVEILPRFRALSDDEIDAKANAADLVTIADRRSEAELAARIGAFWPEALVVGEEAVEAGQARVADLVGADWGVIVDPVDGTWNFAKGLATYGVLISVTRAGVPVWGMLYDPNFDDWIEAGIGQGAQFVNATATRPLRFSAENADDIGLLGYAPLHMFPELVRPSLASEFMHLGRTYNLRCSCHEYRMLVQGHVDFVVSYENKVWDHFPGTLAVTEAGGHVACLDCTPYGLAANKGASPLISARNRDVWDRVAGALDRALA